MCIRDRYGAGNCWLRFSSVFSKLVNQLSKVRRWLLYVTHVAESQSIGWFVFKWCSAMWLLTSPFLIQSFYNPCEGPGPFGKQLHTQNTARLFILSHFQAGDVAEKRLIYPRTIPIKPMNWRQQTTLLSETSSELPGNFLSSCSSAFSAISEFL